MKLDAKSMESKQMADAIALMELGLAQAADVAGILEWRLPRLVAGKAAALRRAKWRAIRRRRFDEHWS